MRKQTLYGPEARAKIMEGVKKIAAAVKVTLGPMGRNVLVSQSAVIDYGVHDLPIRVTKDGYSVTRAFELDEPFEKSGVLMVKEAAQKTVDEAGDGTTSTVILTEAIVIEGVKLIEQGANPMELKKGIDAAVKYVVEELAKIAVPVKGDVDKIRQIATVSANNDKEIGDWIAQAFERIGEEGIIDIEASSGVSTEIKIDDGYKWGNGWASPLFVNKRDKQVCEFENALILLYEKKVTHPTQLEAALTVAMHQSCPILIVCEDIDELGLGFLAMNVAQGRIKACAVKSPGFGNSRREAMEDLAVLTGGDYISDSKGVGVKEVALVNLGKARKVTVSKDETIVIGGNGEPSKLVDVINELRMNLAQAKNEDEKFPIEKRIAKLQGGVAVIQVGAATETEMKEKLDRFDDAVRATKAAISEGYVPGAGTALLRVIPKVDGVDISDIQKGKQLVFNVLESPLLQICKNAGVDGVSILEKVKAAEGDVGYNAKTDEIEDLVKAGIIDPKKVLRCALQNAASSAGMILTSEVLIVDTL